MKSTKIITFLVGFFLGIVAAMAYVQHQDKSKVNPLQQAMDQIKTEQ